MHPEGVFGVGQNVGNVLRAALEGYPGRYAVSSGGDRVAIEEVGGVLRDIAGRRVTQDMPVEAVDRASARPTESHGILDQGLEDRREIEGRAADNLEDLARCRLLFEGLGHLRMSL